MRDRAGGRPRDDCGLGLVGLLVTLALLGLLAAGTAIGLSSLPEGSGGVSTGRAAPAPPTAIEASVTAACRADAESVDVAQQAFRALSNGGAFAGTSATAGGVTLLVKGQYLRSAPGNGTRYTIDTGTNGAVNVTNLRSGATVSFEAGPGICDGT